MDIFRYMDQRAKEIERGKLGYKRADLAAYNSLRPERRMLAMANAANQARADKSDPFVYDRIVSSIYNGASVPEDYSVQWATEKAITQLSKPYVVEVLRPINRKVA